MTWALPYVLARAGNPIVSRDRLIGRKSGIRCFAESQPRQPREAKPTA